MRYFLAMERTDGSMDEPFHSIDGKRAAVRVAKVIAKSASFDCVRVWVENAERNGVEWFKLPEWKE